MGKYLADSYDAALRENADLKTRLASVERERDEIMAMAERREGELQARLARIIEAVTDGGVCRLCEKRVSFGHAPSCPVAADSASSSICPECGCVFGAHRDHCSQADQADQPNERAEK